MSTPLRSHAFAVASVLVALVVSGASAAEEPKRQALFVSAAQLAGHVKLTENGVALHQVATDPSATTLIIRRDKTGEVEVHTMINDIFVVESGHATVTVGGEVKDNHEIRPTEWRGGEISGGQNYELAAGDVLLIPAGLPHKVSLRAGDSFLYVTIKTPVHAAAADSH